MSQCKQFSDKGERVKFSRFCADVFYRRPLDRNSQKGLTARVGQSCWKQEDLGEKPTALSDFCNFSIKLTHFYSYFSQNSYFKAITHRLKASKIVILKQ